MESSPQSLKTVSLLSKGILTHVLTVLSFTVIYHVYTSVVADDFGLERESFLDTQIHSLFLSSFVSAGSVPPNIEPTSSFSRLILIINVLISYLTKIWLITVE